MPWPCLNTAISRTRPILGCFGIGLGLLLATPAMALEIRVGLRQDTDAITVGSSTPAQLIDGKGRVLGQIPELQGFSATAVSGGVSLASKHAWQIALKPKEGGFVYVGDQWYRGQVKLVRSGGGLTVVNQLNMEDYLASVIGKEMYPTWPQEALKAQAVASRSYAMFQKQRPKYSLFDVASTTASQVYVGIAGEANSTQDAVKATSGQVLTYQGKVIEAVFHSASGGHTENSENVWTGTVPYLRGVPDFDQTAPVYQWTLMLTAAQMRQRIPGIGDIVALTPVKTSVTGRVQLMKVKGNQGDRLMKGSDLRTALGLKSTLFSVKPDFGLVAATAGTGKPVSFAIDGKGSGHGLGMSQWGAYGLAQQGKTYRDILTHYFQHTTLKTIY
ncbi:MAG: SpoIID/LytB domain-containing protein [Thermosynechococcaceae cyanobacterium]